MKTCLRIMFAFFVFLVLTSCGHRDPWFAGGTSRSEVYRLLGSPDNIDTDVVSVWIDRSNKPEGLSRWRDLLRNQQVKYIVVFGSDGRSIMPLVSPEQTMITSDMGDKQAQQVARMFFGEGNRDIPAKKSEPKNNHD